MDLEIIKNVCFQFMMHFIIGASSLHHAAQNPNSSFTDHQDDFYALPGLSFVHRNPSKMIVNVLPNLPAGRKFIIWHDVINNSISRHPSNDNEPLNWETLLHAIIELKKKFELVAMIYIKRKKALDLTAILHQFHPHIFVLNMHSVLTTRWKKEIDLGILHLSYEIEMHMVERVLTAENLMQLAKRKHACRQKKNQARLSR